MTTNDRDLRALTYLVRRLREDTYGCAQWDEAGVFSVLKAECAGWSLVEVMQRVIGHACDPDAKTPGAIKRPFVPPVTNAPTREPYDPRATCHDCDNHKPDADHPFRSVEAVRAVPSVPAPQTLRDAIEPTRSWTTPPETEETPA